MNQFAQKHLVILVLLVQILGIASAQEYRIQIKGEMLKGTNLHPGKVKTIVTGFKSVLEDKPEQILLELSDVGPISDTISQEPLLLKKINLLTPDSKIFVDSNENISDISSQIPIYRTKISETEFLNICFTPHGAIGVFSLNDKMFRIEPASETIPEGDNQYHLVTEILTPACGVEWCGTDVSTLTDDIKQMMAKSGEPQLKSSSVQLTAKIAVETDYETYEGFDKDSIKTAAWLLSVIANTSQIFEQEINVKLEVSYLKIWTNPDDPYTSAGYFLMDDFSAYLRQYLNSVERDAAVLLIKNPNRLSGGMSNLDELGNKNNAFLISGEFAFTHELGHLFGSPHTHSCYWPAGPGGTLGPIDQCATVEGNCNITEIINQEGTIMSYCNPILPVFGLFVRNLIRARAELKLGNILPPKHMVSGKATAGGVGLDSVTVRFYTKNNGEFTTITDQNGNYTIQLPDNIYNYQATRRNYLIYPAGLTGIDSWSGSIFLSEKDATGINFEAFELFIDQYETDNSFADATGIEPDGTVYKHTLHVPNDMDFMKFTAVEGKTYYIVCKTERESPPSVVLYNTVGDELGSSSGVPGVLVWKAESSGTYFLRAMGGIGEYTISVSNIYSVNNPGIQPMEYTDVDWGDYDNDGDLDLLISGMSNFLYGYGLYCNENGKFIKVDAGINQGSPDEKTILRWVDIDNDNDLDIVVGSREMIAVYINQNGQFSRRDNYFSNIFGQLLSIEPGDYDGDGDPDLLLQTLDPSRIVIMKNSGQQFEIVDLNLQGASYGKLKWMDYDNDGDADIIVAGSTSGNSVTGPFFRIYKNESGSFLDSGVVLDQITGTPDFDFGDYDGDGDLDLIISGISQGKLTTRILRNDSGKYVDIKALLTGMRNVSVHWGDYDNDGDLDLITSGMIRLDASASGATKLYENRNGNFIETVFSPALLQITGSSEWVDINGDNALDLLLVGEWLDGREHVQLLINEKNKQNSPPSIPTGLKASTDNNKTVLSWEKSTDDNTPAMGLTYNLRVGTSPGGVDVISPLADLSSGKRKVVAPGNTGQLSRKTLQNLKSGTYYWSVQAIDNSFVGSGWAPEQTFSVKANSAPVAHSGPNQTVNGGAIVTLDGSGSFDPENDAITYLWSPPTGIILSSNTVSKPTFSAPHANSITNYTIQLIVNDGRLSSKPDSVTITVKPLYRTNESISICQGSNYMGWTTPGTYQRTLTTYTGCDSIITTNLTVNPFYSISESKTIKEGQNYQGWATTGTYSRKLQSIFGCDSTITTNLVVLAKKFSTENIRICQGASFNGWTTTGQYQRILIAANGADSIITTNLTVNPVYSISENKTIKEGETYKGWTTTGTYTSKLVSRYGCDSTVITYLTVLTPKYSTENIAKCNGESYNGWKMPGTYQRTLTAANGADSIVTTNLSIYPVFQPEVTLNSDTLASANNYPFYQWYDINGLLLGATNKNFVISKSGQYYLEITDQNGCKQTSGLVNARYSFFKPIASYDFRYTIIPNPNTGKFIFRVDSNIDESLVLKLINPAGQVIEIRTITPTLPGYSEQFDISNLSKGIYFLGISSDKLQRSEKIVVQ